jgi:hypothetical protein
MVRKESSPKILVIIPLQGRKQDTSLRRFFAAGDQR